jgi:exonuclease III
LNKKESQKIGKSATLSSVVAFLLLSLMTWNVRGVVKNFSEKFTSEVFGYDVCFFQETFLSEGSASPNFPLTHFFYFVNGKKGRTGRAAGGLITLVRKGVFEAKPDVVFEDSNLLVLKCSVSRGSVPIVIVNVYRACNKSPIRNRNFMNLISNIAYESGGANVVIGGDFNARLGSQDFLRPDDHDFEVEQLCPKKSCDRVVNETGLQLMSSLSGCGFRIAYPSASDEVTASPTFRNSTPLLDFFFIKGGVCERTEVLDFPLSDHFAVSTRVVFDLLEKAKGNESDPSVNLRRLQRRNIDKDLIDQAEFPVSL